HPCFQRVFRAHHHQAGVLNQILDDVGAVPQVIDGGSDVGAASLVHQRVVIILQIRGQQAFDAGPYEIDYRVQVVGLVLDRAPQLLQRGFDGAAAGTSEHHDQPRAELFGREFNTSDQR